MGKCDNCFIFNNKEFDGMECCATNCNDVKKWLAEHDKQIRDGVIDEFAKEMKDLVYKWFESGVIVTSKIDKIAEQLKGGTE